MGSPKLLVVEDDAPSLELMAEVFPDPLNECVRHDRLSGPPKLDLSLDLVGLHRVD
jgi:hypothetical protein